MPCTTLIIRHLPGTQPPAFQVVRGSDGKSTEPVSLSSPDGFPVEGRPNSDLLRELQWYLETFLDYPFPPETVHAERVLSSLKQWGEAAFDGLFGGRTAARLFDSATSEAYAELHLQISSDDPRVLAWPWEALRDPEVGALAHTSQIERRLNDLRDPAPLPKSLPKDRVNILLVVARPYERDVGFRSIARPLVELIERERLPARVELLRPPTFDQLRQHLRERPGFYHILHFDGHGAYGAFAPGQNPGYVMGGAEGKLIFETEDGEPDAISAEQLSPLLRECAVPAVVLNACQSAMLDNLAQDPFASVAAALLRSGMRSVVAMAYSLYVSAAQKFLPAFYGRLFEEGSVGQAVRAGRQQMLAHRGRVCARGEHDLEDWLVPVLYEQDPFDFSFAVTLSDDVQAPPSKLPEELRREKNPYGFVGRDGPILELERALRRPPAGILVQGLGGVGKTTLARGFLQWLDQTGGLGEGCFWFSFQEIRSSEYIFNRLGEALLGGNFATLDVAKKIEMLAGLLRERRFLIVWDNLESAAGIAGTAITANLSEQDRQLMADFLDGLRGGATKVLITSRSTEDWLGYQRRFLLPLSGLTREESWDFCAVILKDLGLKINRDDANLVGLVNMLRGNPLAMRAILPHLERLSASQVAERLRSNLSELKLATDEENALCAVLRFVEQGLPEELKELLVPLSLHDGFLNSGPLESMAKNVDQKWTRSQIDRLLNALVTAGLLRHIGRSVYEMHPALTGYLRSSTTEVEVRNRWARAFVDVMSRLAKQLAPLELHEQRIPFHIHGANFQYALSEAERLGMTQIAAAITQSLASFARNSRNLAVAADLLQRLAELGATTENDRTLATCYHQLGEVMQERLDFAAAEQWYRRSLAIIEKLGNEHDAAVNYHALGRIAQERLDFASAEQWYRKSLTIIEKLGDEPGATIIYHQLGVIAQIRRDFASAEQWYRKSLEISEKLGNEDRAAGTYHQLGALALERRDFASAEQWCRKSLAIEEKHGNEHRAAGTYHVLGIVAQEGHDFALAEQWYRKSLAINEKLGNEQGAAMTYNHLGIVAASRGDFALAEQWYRKSLAIEEKQGNERGVAGTYHQLGIVAQERRDFTEAEEWYRKALVIDERLSNDHGVAITCAQLGVLALLRERFLESGAYFIEAARKFLQADDLHLARQSLEHFTHLYEVAPVAEKAELEKLWKQAGLDDLQSSTQ